MTFLPILQRELRVRARSGGNYWGRVGIGLVGIAVAVPPLVWSSPTIRPAAMGQSALNLLIGGAFLLCCAACLLTADVISRERREGTLGFLFLTRVRTLDVLVGKFASSGLACGLGLVAFVPVLMLPVLAGGVIGGEVARKGLVLVEVLFLALSAGLWASARGTNYAGCARAAMLLLAGIIVLPPLLGLFLPPARLELISPLGTMVRAGDLAYRTSPALYWTSAVVVPLWGCLALGDSLRVLPKKLGSGDGPPPPIPDSAAISANTAPPVIRRCAYCGRQNDAEATHCSGCGTALWPEPSPPHRPIKLADQPTPLHWLLRRKRGLQSLFWLAAVVGFFHYALFGFLGRLFAVGLSPVGFFYGISWTFGFIIAAVTAALIAWGASRYFVEARRSGELELLLTTPVGAQALVPAQWDNLKHLLRGPVLLMLIPPLFQGLFTVVFMNFLGRGNGLFGVYYLLTTGISVVNLVLSVAAQCWLALWLAWRLGVQSRAVIWTVATVELPPYLLGLLAGAVSMLLRFGGWFSGASLLVGSLAPQAVNLVFYLWLIRLARRQLARELSGNEPIPLATKVTQIVRRVRDWPSPRRDP